MVNKIQWNPFVYCFDRWISSLFAPLWRAWRQAGPVCWPTPKRAPRAVVKRPFCGEQFSKPWILKWNCYSYHPSSRMKCLKNSVTNWKPTSDMVSSESAGQFQRTSHACAGKSGSFSMVHSSSVGWVSTKTWRTATWKALENKKKIGGRCTGPFLKTTGGIHAKKNKMKPTNPNADTYVDKQRQYLFVMCLANSFVKHPEFIHWGDTIAWRSDLTLL